MSKNSKSKTTPRTVCLNRHPKPVVGTFAGCCWMPPFSDEHLPNLVEFSPSDRALTDCVQNRSNHRFHSCVLDGLLFLYLVLPCGRVHRPDCTVLRRFRRRRPVPLVRHLHHARRVFEDAVVSKSGAQRCTRQESQTQPRKSALVQGKLCQMTPRLDTDPSG